MYLTPWSRCYHLIVAVGAVVAVQPWTLAYFKLSAHACESVCCACVLFVIWFQGDDTVNRHARRICAVCEKSKANKRGEKNRQKERLVCDFGAERRKLSICVNRYLGLKFIFTTYEPVMPTKTTSRKAKSKLMRTNVHWKLSQSIDIPCSFCSNV